MSSVMPTGAPETFTGADGSAPNATNVAISLNEGSGGGISVQSNQLRIRTGTVQYNRTSVRLTGVSIADVEFVFTWTVPTTLFAYAILRGGSNLDTGNGYLFSLEVADMTIHRHVAYTGPALVTATHGFTGGQVVRSRIAVFGQTLRARTWLASNPEPTSVWQITYTDPSGSGGITAAGMLGWTASSASAGSKDFFVDTADALNTLTPTQAILNAIGSITPAGVLKRQPNKKFTGAMTPAGALTKSRAVLKLLAGAITPAGALNKALVRRFTGAITPAGALRRQANKKFAGTITTAGAARKSLVRHFAGTITPTGDAVAMFVGRVFGRPGLAVMKLLTRSEVRIRHRKG